MLWVNVTRYQTFLKEQIDTQTQTSPHTFLLAYCSMEIK